MNGKCPVCDSPFTAYVRDVPTVRTHRDIPLFTCLDCRSFWNPSGYREDARQLERDAEWGLSVASRNEDAGERLFAALEERGLHFSSVAEIGCGVGTLLRVARDQGKEVVGFDINDRAIQHAVEVNGIPAYAARWTAETPTIAVDLYLCISVLEHLERPRPLLEELCKAAARNRAALYISVPFLERDRWDFIQDPDPARPGTPFLDNDVHVTHFSLLGLMTALREFGQENLQVVDGHLWRGVLGTPEPTEQLPQLAPTDSEQGEEEPHVARSRPVTASSCTSL